MLHSFSPFYLANTRSTALRHHRAQFNAQTLGVPAPQEIIKAASPKEPHAVAVIIVPIALPLIATFFLFLF
jgi:hypothetical protein